MQKNLIDINIIVLEFINGLAKQAISKALAMSINNLDNTNNFSLVKFILQ